MATTKKITNLKTQVKDAQRRFEMAGYAYNLRGSGATPKQLRQAEKTFTRTMITKKSK